jgi:hypothetical protein
MKINLNSILSFLLLVGSFFANAQELYPSFDVTKQKDSPNQMSNAVMPVMGVWVWGQKDLVGNGYKKSIDNLSESSPFNLIVPFLRFPDYEVVDQVVYEKVKEAANYAVKKNVLLVPDLDVRNARRAFEKRFPNELQKMLRLKEVEFPKRDSVLLAVKSQDLNDHYSGGDITHHVARTGTLLRVYSYKYNRDGMIQKESLKDITSSVKLISSSKDSVKVNLPVLEDKTHATVMVSFTHLYPDVFAPHLMGFQRELIEQYAELPLAGVCKDEWGFPPYYPRFSRHETIDYWYSEHRAKAYAERTSGRELLADCLLMANGIEGKENERNMAINHFTQMVTERNSALEEDFYYSVKDIFGSNAVVAVHATWWPYPDRTEFKKNGLVWWSAKRDWAQTDELTPYAVRTALSKKWGSPLWYNMYYQEPDLGTHMWSSVLAGGRINYLRYFYLFDEDLMQAENRIRLLNYISKTPLDCRVAVVFGHSSAMNWSGPEYEDVGMELVDSLWHKGFPADLIPTSEIEKSSLTVNSDGSLKYGLQKYDAVVLYNPEFEKGSTAEFFSKVNEKETALYRIGDWTKDFSGNPLDGNGMLPDFMSEIANTNQALLKLLELLKKKKVLAQSPATEILDNSVWDIRDFNHTSYAPPTTGFSRLIDGTVIHIAGTNDKSGDPIVKTFKVNNHMVTVDAVGVAAVRLDEQGRLEAIAAGGLKRFKGGEMEIILEERMDMALWIDKDGEWQGIIQTEDEVPVPEELSRITANWSYLKAPTPPQ